MGMDDQGAGDRLRASSGGTARSFGARCIRSTILAVICALSAAGSAHAAAGGGLQLLSTQQLDPRLTQLTFHTDALASPTQVRILLPAGYDASSARRYPVLYLLHGTSGDDTDWTVQGDAEAITAGLPLIVVMPSGGQGGFYSDWYNNGAGGPPQWETYHIGQLLPWIDGHYRTTGTRAGRAIAGLSMGGFGAFSYASRHPDLFVSAASFSGVLNTNEPPGAGEPDESTLDGGAPFSTWGPRATEEVRWRAHDPWDLATNLRGLDLTIRTGNGNPGGPYPYNPVAALIESYAHTESADMHGRLGELGIAHVWDDYGAGDHSWPYWQRDLRETLPDIMAAFAHPPAPPSPFTFTAVEGDYSVYGWHVTLNRAALEFSTLADASRAGFTLSGSGTATVTTASLYRPAVTYVVRVTDAGGGHSTTLHADGAGRLSIPVSLAPSNPYQQFTAQASALGSAVHSAAVTVESGPSAVRGRAGHRHRHHRHHRRRHHRQARHGARPRFTG